MGATDQRPGGADGLEGEQSSGILEGMHRFLSLTPSALKCVALVDMVSRVPHTSKDLSNERQFVNFSSLRPSSL